MYKGFREDEGICWQKKDEIYSFFNAYIPSYQYVTAALQCALRRTGVL